MTNDPISRIEAALAEGTFDFGQLCCEKGEWSGSPDEPPVCCGRPLSCAVDIRTLLDRLKAAEEENERLRCNAMQWRKPGPVTAEHPLDCLIVVPSIRQADGDWWIKGSEFLADDAPIAWCADTSIARAALENTDAR